MGCRQLSKSFISLALMSARDSADFCKTVSASPKTGMPSDHLVTDLFDHLILLNEAFRLGDVAGEQSTKSMSPSSSCRFEPSCFDGLNTRGVLHARDHGCCGLGTVLDIHPGLSAVLGFGQWTEVDDIMKNDCEIRTAGNWRNEIYSVKCIDGGPSGCAILFLCVQQ